MTLSQPLKVDNLYVSYGQNEVIRSLNLEAEEGEFLGLIGPNGCGKSTLINALSGSVNPTDGRVFLYGKDMKAMSSRDRARLVAVVPQNPTIPIGFTVEEVVLMGRNPHLGLLQWERTKDIEVALRALELTNTAKFVGRFLTGLSGGEVQRVFIARALAQQTPLLLLDEPTAHLDIAYQTSVLDVVEIIRQRTGVTVLAAMHDLTLAAQYCDRVALMSQGGILTCGSPADVLNQDSILKAFGIHVHLLEHPVHGTPVVLPASDPVDL